MQNKTTVMCLEIEYIDQHGCDLKIILLIETTNVVFKIYKKLIVIM